MITAERKGTQLTDEQCRIVSQTFHEIRKIIVQAKLTCLYTGYEEAPVLHAVADLVASLCGQQIK